MGGMQGQLSSGKAGTPGTPDVDGAAQATIARDSAFEWPPPDEALLSRIVEIEEVEGTVAPFVAKRLTERQGSPRPVPVPSALPERAQEIPANPLPSTDGGQPVAEVPAARPTASKPLAVQSLVVGGALAALVLTPLTVGVIRYRSAPQPSVQPNERITMTSRSVPIVPVVPAAASKVPAVPTSPNPRALAVERSAPRTSEAVPATGRLVIRSDPGGADILVNGKHRGITPKTLTVVPGSYQIVLTRGGTEVLQDVFVNRGATVSVVAPLASAVGTAAWLAITSSLELDVYEKGTLLGTSRSPRIMVSAGSHSFELVNDEVGFRQVRSVQLEAGKVEPLGVEAPTNMIHLNAIPWAEVWIDDTSVGETPIGNLSITLGRHDVVFRHPELGEKRIPAIVRSGAATRVTVDMRSSSN
jgi:PEGA domain